MSRPLSCLFLLLMLTATGRADPLVLHVRTGGVDGACATLEEARDTIRAARRMGNLSEGAEVHIHGGDHIRNTPFELTVEDSGTAAAPIRYVGDSTKPARLLGGRIVDGFVPITDQAVLRRLAPESRSHIVQIDLNTIGVADFGSPGAGIELFFGGERMTLARWPNEGFSKIVDVVDYDGHEVRGTKGSHVGKFHYKDERPDGWTDETAPWVHGYWFWDWAEQRHPVEAIDTKSKSITVKQPYHNYGYRKGQWYYAYNLLCELDAPGEWYLDRDCGVLYFWPPGDLASTEVMVTLAPSLLTLRGASHVTVERLTLEGGRGTAVEVTEGANVQLFGLTVCNGGGAAIHVRGGNHHSVEGCDIYGMGSSGISINGGDRKTLTAAGHRAVNNHIHHYAQVKRVYAAGIHVNGVGNLVANNSIHDAPHMAIGFGGNDHIIELNEIHDVCLETNDAGAMYAGRNWTMRGHIIRYNSLYDITGFHDRGSVGVYLDDMFSSATIYGNLFRNVTRAAFIGGGRDNTIENNVFIDCKLALHIDARALGWAHGHADKWLAEQQEERTISGIAYNRPPFSERYPDLIDIVDNNPKAPVGNLVTRNIFVGENWNDVHKDAKPYIASSDNLTGVDPQFVDRASCDYRLRPESPAIDLGFQPIPLERIGLFASKLRASQPSE
ncbi:hypothetical protein CA13_58980 [Planctomycetes bacterium CA13]|uniref:Right handed beta helix domain-containing protein n=1 Tax=Novipirellula herctigrandis TaxID=2527986 RepID=A0A5C5ZB43_9BACT|nr:hypothetical protein CA13_58980 [Planctomycetes bacterium CA13]